MAKRVVILDSGYWFGVCRRTDNWHESATRFHETLLNVRNYEVLIPFPTYYEILRTEFVEERGAHAVFFNEFRKLNTRVLYDDRVREQALEAVEEHGHLRRRSLVDALIVELMKTERVDFLITVDRGFEEDCRRQRITLCNLTQNVAPEGYGLI